MFVKRIRDGAGLVMLGGYHSLGPGGYGGTPLGDVLPVALGSREIGPVTDPFLPLLTPDGMHHPIFANIAGFFPTPQGPPKIAGLPPLGRLHARRPARGRAPRVLATVSGRGGPDARAGRAAVGPRPDGRLRRRHHAQMAARPAGAEPGLALPAVLGANGPLAGRPRRQRRDPGQHRRQHRQGLLRAGRADPHFGHRPRQGRPRRQQRQGRGHGPRAEPAGPNRSTLSAVAGPGGHYGGTIEPQSAGGYEVVVEARLGELSLKADKIAVEVGRPNLEFEKLDLDEKMLERIAADTGGRYVPLATADHLIDQLDRTPAQEDRSRRAAALLAARFLGAVRGRADDGMDTEKEISTQIEEEREVSVRRKKGKGENGNENGETRDRWADLSGDWVYD